MVYRVFVEKKEGLRAEAAALKNDAKTQLGITRLEDVRIVNRYDVENIDEALFEECIWKVFAEPQLDNVAGDIEELFLGENACIFGVEALPGQFDQRADSAEQCIQFISQGERPTVKFARIYVLYGELMPADIDAIENYVINPVETRKASLEKPESLQMEYDIPETVETLDGFIDMEPGAYQMVIDEMGLAMERTISACASSTSEIPSTETRLSLRSA